MKPSRLFLFCAVAFAALLPRAQEAPARADVAQAGVENPPVPTITYDRVWEAATPQNVTIVVESTGPTRFHSSNPVKPPDQSEPDPDFTLEFTMSQANRDKLFRAAREANYFKGDFAFKKHAVATTGKKTLTYADQARHFETTFDYSENQHIQQIVNIFQGIASTIRYGRKLQYLHRYDRLGLEAELKAMENAVESHNLEELQLLAPTLEKIANAAAILNIARQRARRLLAKSSAQ